MPLRDFGMPVSRCPHCGHEVDAATETIAEGKKPRPGDASICINCGKVNVFTVTLHLRKATPREAQTFAKHPLVKRALLALAIVHAKHGRRDN